MLGERRTLLPSAVGCSSNWKLATFFDDTGMHVRDNPTPAGAMISIVPTLQSFAWTGSLDTTRVLLVSCESASLLLVSSSLSSIIASAYGVLSCMAKPP